MYRKSLKINPKDSVAMLLEDGLKGDYIETPEGKTVLQENIEFAHKVALSDMKKGQPVMKYGEEIGYMLCDVPRGTWIHNHNMGCDRGKREEKCI